MIKEVTKVKETIDSITGGLETSKERNINFIDKKICQGIKFQGKWIPSYATFAEILEGATTTQKNIIIGMFKKAEVIAVNRALNLVEPVTIADSDTEME